MSDYTSVPSAPPAYGENPDARVAGDNVPDDFKYSVDVASCELPVRQLFVRKVYALLSVQILATVVVGTIIKASPSIQTWCFNNMWMYIVSIVGVFGFLIATMIKSKSYPINLVLLSGFTLCESYGLGMTCSMFESDVVLKAVFLTLFIFIGLTAFAFQTKYDMRSWQSALNFGVWILIAWGFIFMFFGSSPIAELVYSSVGAIIFGIYVIVDTQHIMKTFHLDEEVAATITLYLDIINLFLFILRILSRRND